MNLLDKIGLYLDEAQSYSAKLKSDIIKKKLSTEKDPEKRANYQKRLKELVNEVKGENE